MSQLTKTVHAPRRGFTLLEMLVVLTIMAVLTTVAAQSLEPVAQKSRAEATQRTLEAVRAALHSVTHTGGSTSVAGFVSDLRRLPNSWQELFDRNLIASNNLWHGPYILPPGNATTLVDAWGRPIRLTFTNSQNIPKPSFDSLEDVIVLSSDGPDGQVDPPGDIDPDDIQLRAPASHMSARQLRIRLYAVDAQGNALDISPTEPKVTIAAVGATGTAQETVAEGLDRVFTFDATPAELLAGSYQVTITDAAAPAGQTGTAYNPTTRLSILPGGTHSVDLLVFRGTQASADPEPDPMP